VILDFSTLGDQQQITQIVVFSLWNIKKLHRSQNKPFFFIRQATPYQNRFKLIVVDAECREQTQNLISTVGGSPLAEYSFAFKAKSYIYQNVKNTIKSFP